MKAKFEERSSAELNEAIPKTDILNIEAQKERAELARQGSLAERQPPAGLLELRQKLLVDPGVVRGEESEDSIVRRSNHTSLQSSSIPVVEGYVGGESDDFVSYSSYLFQQGLFLLSERLFIFFGYSMIMFILFCQ